MIQGSEKSCSEENCIWPIQDFQNDFKYTVKPEVEDTFVTQVFVYYLTERQFG